MSNQNKTKIIGLIVIVLLTSASTAGAVAYESGVIRLPSFDTAGSATSTTSSTASGSSTTNSTQTDTTPSTTGSTGTTTYKDGTYTANGSYYTPDGPEEIGVTITISSDKISSVSIDDTLVDNNESYAYAQRFKQGIDQAVVGQNISDVQVYRISGSSLTPIGFNNALEAIKNNAAV